MKINIDVTGNRIQDIILNDIMEHTNFSERIEFISASSLIQHVINYVILSAVNDSFEDDELDDIIEKNCICKESQVKYKVTRENHSTFACGDFKVKYTKGHVVSAPKVGPCKERHSLGLFIFEDLKSAQLYADGLSNIEIKRVLPIQPLIEVMTICRCDDPFSISDWYNPYLKSKDYMSSSLVPFGTRACQEVFVLD